MKKIVTIFLLSIFSLCSIAQSDAKSTAILNDIIKNINSFKSIKISFTNNVGSLKQKTQASYNGTMWYKNGKYKLMVANQEIICDGKTSWTYLKDANEVQINEISENQAFSPVKLFDGSLVKDFKSKFAGELNGLQTIELYPVTLNKSFSKVILTINKPKKQISKFTIYDKSGNIYTYTVKVFQANPPINESLFTFNAKNYPGVEINDMR